MAASDWVRGDSAFRVIASYLALALMLMGGASQALADASSRENDRQIVRVKRGDTLSTLLAHWGATPTEAQDVASALRPIWNPRELRIGQEVALKFGPAGLETIEIDANLDHAVRAQRNADGHFSPTTLPRNLARVPRLSVGVIKTSLYDAAVIAGVPQPVLQEMARAFSYDVDFQREVQPGDTFELMFENIVDKRGEVIANGAVIYASMTLSGHTLRVYRFQPEDGFADYFNPAGQSVKKALLRTPIDGAKLTSGFGMRNHPILGYSRMHRGLDFGAPAGTPIMAAGDGVVDMAGANGSYGNYVRIRHNDFFSTAYAHMSRFAAGIHRGTWVHQGEIIGYVGATGLATGPHLHYEVLAHEHQVNPMSVKMPSNRQLAGVALKRFNVAVADIEREVHALPDPFTVATTAQSEGDGAAMP